MYFLTTREKVLTKRNMKMYQSCEGMKLQKFLLTHLFTIFLKKTTLRTGRHFQFYWK